METYTYYCECCKYGTNVKGSYNKHLVTKKHESRSALPVSTVPEQIEEQSTPETIENIPEPPASITDALPNDISEPKYEVVPYVQRNLPVNTSIQSLNFNPFDVKFDEGEVMMAIQMFADKDKVYPNEPCERYENGSKEQVSLFFFIVKKYEEYRNIPIRPPTPQSIAAASTMTTTITQV